PHSAVVLCHLETGRPTCRLWRLADIRVRILRRSQSNTVPVVKLGESVLIWSRVCGCGSYGPYAGIPLYSCVRKIYGKDVAERPRTRKDKKRLNGGHY